MAAPPASEFGPLPEPVSKAVTDGDLMVASCALGQSQFRGPRQSADPRQLSGVTDAGVIYALAGSMKIDITRIRSAPARVAEGLSEGSLADQRRDCQVRDEERHAHRLQTRYADVFHGDKFWRGIKIKPSLTYDWDNKSTYVQNRPISKA